MAVLFALAAPARAQSGPTAEDRAAAAASAGRELFEQGRWMEAHARFTEAQSLAYSPVFELYAARALRNAGKLVGARERYAHVVETELPASAPPAFTAAKDDAKRELAQLEPRIPRLTFRPSRPLARGGEILVDGAVVAAGATSHPVDPGEHVVTVREAGREVAKRSVRADAGGAVEVPLELAAAGTSPASPAVDSPKDSPPESANAGSLVPGGVVLGVGLAGLLVGGITGGLAASKKSDLEDACGADGACPRAQQETIDDANLLATVSTAMFVAGGIVTAGGITLMILRPGGGADPPPKSAVSFSLGIGSAAVRLKF